MFVSLSVNWLVNFWSEAISRQASKGKWSNEQWMSNEWSMDEWAMSNEVKQWTGRRHFSFNSFAFIHCAANVGWRLTTLNFFFDYAILLLFHREPHWYTTLYQLPGEGRFLASLLLHRVLAPQVYHILSATPLIVCFNVSEHLVNLYFLRAPH